MRKSLVGLLGVAKDNYKGLPEELKEFNYYIPDGGNSIMVIPESFRSQAYASGRLDAYEVGIPVKYVLEKGYTVENGYVFCDVPYDNKVGAIVDEKYEEWDQSNIEDDLNPLFNFEESDLYKKCMESFAKLNDETPLTKEEIQKIIEERFKLLDLKPGLYVTDICVAREISPAELEILKDFEKRTHAVVYHIIKDLMGMTCFLYVPYTKGELQAQINCSNNSGWDWQYAYCYNESIPEYSECGPIHVKKSYNNCLVRMQ